MKKVWLIAKTTFWRRMRSGTFLLLTFGLPAIMVIAGAIPFLRELRSELPNVGIVDQTSSLERIDPFVYDGARLDLTFYPDEESALQAYRAGSIQAFLLIPQEYEQGARPKLYSSETPSQTVQEALETYLRNAISAGKPEWLLDRFQDPADFTYSSLESDASVSEGPGLLIRVITPVALGLLFALSIFTGASQLGSVVVREKDQRSMEMILTSMRPSELVAGKVLGVTMVSIAQLGIWALGGVVAIGMALSKSFQFTTSMIHTQAIFWALVLGVPGYFLYATVAAGLGLIAGDRQQARQLAGMLGFIGMTPLYLAGIVAGAPDSALAVALSLFPLTAPTFGLIRLTLTSVPLWQLTAAAGIMLVCLLIGIWIVARLFRTAMLMYGQRLSAAEVWRAIRQSG